eukprot:TRINITY_DN12876_c0_g1_i3.p1 TRINITY_DN12876_c0_g1~~TRINITY_DN12876_c0_g1_i3.p1  ORF type:complete len:357 (-),score=91.82 TRINITY_DN12876_c0_g1_i3:950-2020(-)
MTIAWTAVRVSGERVGSVHPQWVSINNGVYVCYNCSGVHRGFGVQYSFIRSLSMDAISDKQRKILSHGGNKRFAEFMEMYGLNSTPAGVKYKTKAAEFYRGMLKAMTEGTAYNQPMPDEEEGREVLKSYSTNEPKTLQQTPSYESYSNQPAHDIGEGNEGFFDKIAGAAKDFGQMTKSAAGSVWEKGKSLAGNEKIGALASATKKGLSKAKGGLTSAGKAIANKFSSLFGKSHNSMEEEMPHSSESQEYGTYKGVDVFRHGKEDAEEPEEHKEYENHHAIEEAPKRPANVDLLGLEDTEQVEPKKSENHKNPKNGSHEDSKNAHNDLFDMLFENGGSDAVQHNVKPKTDLLDLDFS